MSVRRAGGLESSLLECSTMLILQFSRCDEEVLELVQQSRLVRQSLNGRAPRDRAIVRLPINRERLAQQLKLLACENETKDQLMLLADRLILVPAPNFLDRSLLPQTSSSRKS